MKGIYVLFIVTEILCYIFAILFPPPNKSLPQIASLFPYQLLSRLSLSIEPGAFLFLLFICPAHFPQGTGSSGLVHLLRQRVWPQASSPFPPQRSAEAALVPGAWEEGKEGPRAGWGVRVAAGAGLGVDTQMLSCACLGE